MKKACILISLILFSAGCLQADSLWRSYSNKIYQPGSRKVSVGDMVTIYVSESTSAVQQASTSTGKSSAIGTSLSSNWDKLTTALGNNRDRRKRDIAISGNDAYRGTGQTERKSSVKAVITAIVTEVLESGNLFVVGEHKVKVNHDIETIRVSGIIRPADITRKNTVFSYQIAKAEVSVSGSGGPVSSKQTPGILGKVVNWIF
eukprot:COSAG01_NODE_519_length_16012_cov_4.344058_19_plen_203_part_00